MRRTRKRKGCCIDKGTKAQESGGIGGNLTSKAVGKKEKTRVQVYRCGGNGGKMSRCIDEEGLAGKENREER